MDWTWYLFSFEGRINRAKYWLAGLIVVCWMLFLALLTVTASAVSGKIVSFGFNIDDLFRIVDPASYQPLPGLPVLAVKAIGMALFLWVYFATSIKRLHDRDKSGWWMISFFAVPGLFNQFADRLGDSYFTLLPGVVVFVLGIWGFVEMYLLKGSRKTNRFGPNPLLRAEPRPRWDPNREVEMVPHKAGPPPV